MVENIVAAVYSVVPGVPDIREYGIVGSLLEMIEIVPVLSGDRHCGELALVTSISQFVDEKAHLGLQLVVAAVNALVEIIIGLVIVAFGHGVRRVLLEEAIATGSKAKSRKADQS